MLVDANLLLFAVDAGSPFHAAAAGWLEDALNGPRRVGIPWPSLVAFMRISTHPRVFDDPLGPSEARDHVAQWVNCENVWNPAPTDHHADVLGSIVARYEIRGNLIGDAHLAALAIEHGIAICSADTDFARFAEITWINPLAKR